MNILIDKVKIMNFRALRNVEVHLSKMILLVGANNAGKTSFLRALNSTLGGGAVNKDDLFVDKDGVSPSNEIIIDVRIIPTDESGERQNEFETSWLSVFGEQIQSENGNQDFFAFRTKYSFDNQKDIPKKEMFFISQWGIDPVEGDKLTSKFFENIILYFMDAQRDLQLDLKSRASYFSKLATQIEYNSTDLEDIEEKIQTLNEKAVSSSLVLKHLKTELKNLNDTTQTTGNGVEINPFPKRVRDLHKGMKVNFQDNGSDTFGLEYHGMGTRSWASILSFQAFIGWESELAEEKYNPYYPVLALEEPEAHLHPNAQRTLYLQLSKITGQKIISTHSPYITGQAQLEEVRHFYKAVDEVEVSQIDLSSLGSKELNSIRLGIYASRGDVFFSKKIVLFEGETEEFSLPLFAEKHFGTSPSALNIDFIKAGNNYHLLHLVKFLKTSWFIFSDYDNPTVEANLQSVLNKCGFGNDPNSLDNVFTLGNNFETYLYDDGYEAELKSTLKEIKEPVYHNEPHRIAKETEVAQENQRIEDLSRDSFLSELKDFKTKASFIYTRKILERTDGTHIPTKVKQLFETISR